MLVVSWGPFWCILHTDHGIMEWVWLKRAGTPSPRPGCSRPWTQIQPGYAFKTDTRSMSSWARHGLIVFLCFDVDFYLSRFWLLLSTLFNHVSNVGGLLPRVCFRRIPLAASCNIRLKGMRVPVVHRKFHNSSREHGGTAVSAHSGHLWESPNHSNLLVSHSDKKETHERRQESHHFVEWKASQVKIER